jgi:SSS family transporter
MGINLSPESWQVLITFICYLVGVLVLGIVSHQFLTRGSFVKEYFIGNRGLGPWVLALTIAATSISGGTFMGFPSLIYSNGWVMGLWIACYMVVPLTSMVLMGKRINQVARIAGAVTVPDVLRDRYQSPVLGIVSTLLILFCLAFNLVAQFKGGGLVMKEALGLPPEKVAIPVLNTLVDQGYLIGLLIFALTVVAYTTYGGFWAVTWNDVLQGLVMLAGVLMMAVLAMQAVPPVTVERVAASSPGPAPVVTDELHGLAAATERLRQQDPALVYGPGPGNYLPFGLAFSFFLMWSLMGAGQPSGMVRLMSFKDAASLRRALLLVAGYYVLTYLGLLVIFVCARAILPTQYLRGVGSEGEPDSIMPVMARYVTRHAGYPWLAGLMLAAPYAAIMSTVAAFLLMISSSLVRDLYQRTLNPSVSPRVIKLASYLVTALVGMVVMIGALNPPGFLQYVIVFTGTGQGCAFLVPMLLTLYWRRSTRAGILASMLGGFLTVVGLYTLGWIDSGTQTSSTEWAHWLQSAMQWFPGWGEKRPDAFAPLYVGGYDPLVWGLLVSVVLGINVSLTTRPDPELVKKYFP